MLIKQKDLLTVAAELLACAVLELFPNAKVTHVYLTDLGFAADFTFGKPLDDSLFGMLEERMRILSKQELVSEPVTMMRENAAELLLHKGQEFLAERAEESPSNLISLLRIGTYYGLGSIQERISVKRLGSIKLIRYAASPQSAIPHLTSVEGVLCEDNSALKKFIKRWSLEKENDCLLLGPKLNLFFQPPGALPGSWTFLPKGEQLKETLLNWWRDLHREAGYLPVSLAKWYESGDFKGCPSQGVEIPGEGEEMVEYLSDCGQLFTQPLIAHLPSFEEEPLRLCEISQVIPKIPERKNLGVFQERVFTKDHAYSLCMEGQAHHELISSLQFIEKCIKIFLIDYQWYLVSAKPKTSENQELRVGKAQKGAAAEEIALLREEAGCQKDAGLQMKAGHSKGAALRIGKGHRKEPGVQSGDNSLMGPEARMLVTALEELKIDYIHELEEKPSGSARVEVRFIDNLEREWKGPGVGVHPLKGSKDPKMMGRGSSGQRKMLIARTLFGSLERFVGMLIQRHAGLLPLWLAPEQVRVIPVKGEHVNYAREIRSKLLLEGIRADMDLADLPLAAKIFAVKTARVPYALVVGDVEQRNGTVAVCPCEDSGKGMKESLGAFISRLKSEIESKNESRSEL